VLDANILIRAVLGTRVRRILENYTSTISFFVPESALLEAREHLATLVTGREGDPAKALRLLDAIPASTVVMRRKRGSGWVPATPTTGRFSHLPWRSVARSGPKIPTFSVVASRPGHRTESRSSWPTKIEAEHYMNFHCEDLPQAGVVLIPRDSHAFQPFCSDIKSCLEAPPTGSPPPFSGETPELPDEDDPASAILWNQSGKPICAFTLIWKYDWKDGKYRWKDGRRVHRKTGSTNIFGVGHSPSLLLPFGLREDRRAFEAYWRTILPYSKRYVDSSRVLGANADVRPPAPDEQWNGGVMRWGGPGPHEEDRADTVTLTLDAVFFSTGECVGPDTKQLWDRVIVAAELHQEVAAAARSGVEAAFDVERILAEVEQITGDASHPPPPPPPPGGPANSAQFREYERRSLAQRIS